MCIGVMNCPITYLVQLSTHDSIVQVPYIYIIFQLQCHANKNEDTSVKNASSIRVESTEPRELSELASLCTVARRPGDVLEDPVPLLCRTDYTTEATPPNNHIPAVYWVSSDMYHLTVGPLENIAAGIGNGEASVSHRDIHAVDVQRGFLVRVHEVLDGKRETLVEEVLLGLSESPHSRGTGLQHQDRLAAQHIEWILGCTLPVSIKSSSSTTKSGRGTKKGAIEGRCGIERDSGRIRSGCGRDSGGGRFDNGRDSGGGKSGNGIVSRRFGECGEVGIYSG
jgi:hypothetical protein